MEILRPRMARSSAGDNLARSLPSNSTWPLVMRPTVPRYCMTANATVDLPQPDSPTRPSASPWPSLKLMFGTTFISPARTK